MINKLTFLSICFVLLLANIALAQTAKSDSLEQILSRHNTDDTVKVNLLNQIAFEIWEKNDQKAMSYALQAGEISERLNFRKGKSESMRLVGLSYYNQDKQKALSLEFEAMKFAEGNKDRNGALRCLYDIAYIYRKMGNDSISFVCFQKAIQMADSLNDKLILGKSHLNLASIYYKQGNNDLAIEGFSKAILNFTQINEKKYKASAFNSLGTLYVNYGNYPKAIECFHKGLTDFEALKDTSGIFMISNALGNVYSNNSKMNESYAYYTQALKMAEALNDKIKITMCLNNIGIYYFKTNNPLAKEYFQKVLANCETIQQPIFQQGAFQRMGNIYEKDGDLLQAKIYYQKALNIVEEEGLKANLSFAAYYLGRVYLKQHQYAEALSLSLKGLVEAKRFDIVSAQKDLNEQLAEIYSAKGDFKNAYLHYKQFKTLNDSIYNESNIKKITELDFTYKFEKEKQALELEQQKKDAIQLAEIKQQRIVIASFIVAFVFMSLLAVYIYRGYRIKKETNLLLTLQKSEIESKNKELIQLNEEILAQKEEITSISNEVEMQNIQLHELNATKDKFFSIIAHDLRNPFSIIIGGLTLVDKAVKDNDQKQSLRFIDMLQTSANGAYKLLENLLEWARSQTGSFEFKPQKLSLKGIVSDTIAMCNQQAKDKNISLTEDLPDQIAVYADQNMLNTIIRNLITNAIKFTHKGGNIHLSCVCNDRNIALSVRDNGIGMDENTRIKLFKINEKISILGTEQERGTGLGLLLCKEFVEKHGGSIWVESELGKGSEFMFTMPLNIGHKTHVA